MYKITEWNERYEVSSKGREPKQGEELRAGPLQYIRLKVYGHSQGTGYRRMKHAAGTKAMEVFGIFCKFLEISGNQKKGKRGDLLNENDEPASIQDLAFILDVSESQVKNALNVLCMENVGWLTNTTQHNPTQPTQPIQPTKEPEIPGKFPEITDDSDLIADFDSARKLFRGRKNGLAPELKNFQKKHKNWIEIIPLLTPAIENQIVWRKQDNCYWKNFQTWINNSCWTEEKETYERNNGQTTQTNPSERPKESFDDQTSNVGTSVTND